MGRLLITSISAFKRTGKWLVFKIYKKQILYVIYNSIKVEKKQTVKGTCLLTGKKSLCIKIVFFFCLRSDTDVKDMGSTV